MGSYRNFQCSVYWDSNTWPSYFLEYSTCVDTTSLCCPVHLVYGVISRHLWIGFRDYTSSHAAHCAIFPGTHVVAVLGLLPVQRPRSVAYYPISPKKKTS